VDRFASGLLHCIALTLVLLVISGAETLHAQAADNRAPSFSLPDAEGRFVGLDDFRGRIVVLNFWATWCAPCRHEMPAFVRLQSRYPDRVSFVGVSVDEKGWSVINPFVREIGVNYTILLDQDSATLERYGDPSALPATFLIDEEGTLRVIIQGMVSEADLDEILKLMLSGAAI
jgi:peroxiredoxin